MMKWRLIEELNELPKNSFIALYKPNDPDKKYHYITIYCTRSKDIIWNIEQLKEQFTHWSLVRGPYDKGK